jgi:hypothetical protein
MLGKNIMSSTKQNWRLYVSLFAILCTLGSAFAASAGVGGVPQGESGTSDSSDESSSDGACTGDVEIGVLYCVSQSALENMEINEFFSRMSQQEGGTIGAVELLCGSNLHCISAATNCSSSGCPSESVGQFAARFGTASRSTKADPPAQSAESPSAKHFEKLRAALQGLCRLNINPFSSAPSQLTVWEKIKDLLKSLGKPPAVSKPGKPLRLEEWAFPGVPNANEPAIKKFLDQVDRFFKGKKISDALRLLDGLKKLFKCSEGACDGQYQAICDALKGLEDYLRGLGNENPIPQDVIDKFKDLLRRLLEDKSDPIQ